MSEGMTRAEAAEKRKPRVTTTRDVKFGWGVTRDELIEALEGFEPGARLSFHYYKGDAREPMEITISGKAKEKHEPA